MEDTNPRTDDESALPHITCGCGFTVAGADEDNNRIAYENHDCSDAASNAWYSYVFGLWGWAIVAAITWAIVAIFNHWAA